MKKLIIFTLALSLILAAAVSASQTRVWTMGDNNRILVDDANIWMFPSRLNDYPHLAIGEFSASSDFDRFGIHWQFGDDDPWVLATYFEDFGTYYPFFFLPFTPTSSNRRGHFFYARNLGTNKFGGRASLYWSGYEETDNAATPYQFKESFRYWEFSLGLTADDNSWDVSATGGFGTWTDEFAGVSQTEPDGLLDLMVMGRMFWNSGPNYQYVPHASLEYHKSGVDYFDGTGANDENENVSGFMIDLGIGQVYTPSANVEACLDFGIEFASYTYEYNEVVVVGTDDSYEDKFSFRSLPYFKLGLDAEVFSWMDIRFGATNYWSWEKDEETYVDPTLPNVFEYKYNYTSNDTYLGFGFHWGNLHVDTYTDPEVFLNGFDFISGDGNGDMNFQISATYDMM